MPFVPALRAKLQALKEEYVSGLLPQIVYEELCRKAINAYGDNNLDYDQAENVDKDGEAGEFPIPRQIEVPYDLLPNKKSIYNVQGKVQCPLCDVLVLNYQGLSTHLAKKHKRTLEDFDLAVGSESDKRGRRDNKIIPPTPTIGISSTENEVLSNTSSYEEKSQPVKLHLPNTNNDDKKTSSAADDNLTPKTKEESPVSVTQESNVKSSQHELKPTSDTETRLDVDKETVDIVSGDNANIPNLSESKENKDDNEDDSDNNTEEDDVDSPPDINSTPNKMKSFYIDNKSNQENYGYNTSSNNNKRKDRDNNDEEEEEAEHYVKKFSNTYKSNSHNYRTQLEPGETVSYNGQDSHSVDQSDTKNQDNLPRIDRRRNNRGCAHRKSYSKEVKRRCIALRDSGLSVDEIAKILDTAKSNVEKWCSIKAREKILTKATKLEMKGLPQRIPLHLQDSTPYGVYGSTNPHLGSIGNTNMMNPNSSSSSVGVSGNHNPYMSDSMYDRHPKNTIDNMMYYYEKERFRDHDNMSPTAAAAASASLYGLKDALPRYNSNISDISTPLHHSGASSAVPYSSMSHAYHHGPHSSSIHVHHPLSYPGSAYNNSTLLSGSGLSSLHPPPSSSAHSPYHPNSSIHYSPRDYSSSMNSSSYHPMIGNSNMLNDRPNISSSSYINPNTMSNLSSYGHNHISGPSASKNINMNSSAYILSKSTTANDYNYYSGSNDDHITNTICSNNSIYHSGNPSKSQSNTYNDSLLNMNHHHSSGAPGVQPIRAFHTSSALYNRPYPPKLSYVSDINPTSSIYTPYGSSPSYMNHDHSHMRTGSDETSNADDDPISMNRPSSSYHTQTNTTNTATESSYMSSAIDAYMHNKSLNNNDGNKGETTGNHKDSHSSSYMSYDHPIATNSTNKHTSDGPLAINANRNKENNEDEYDDTQPLPKVTDLTSNSKYTDYNMSRLNTTTATSTSNLPGSTNNSNTTLGTSQNPHTTTTNANTTTILTYNPANSSNSILGLPEPSSGSTFIRSLKSPKYTNSNTYRSTNVYTTVNNALNYMTTTNNNNNNNSSQANNGSSQGTTTMSSTSNSLSNLGNAGSSNFNTNSSFYNAPSYSHLSSTSNIDEINPSSKCMQPPLSVVSIPSAGLSIPTSSPYNSLSYNPSSMSGMNNNSSSGNPSHLTNALSAIPSSNSVSNTATTNMSANINASTHANTSSKSTNSSTKKMKKSNITAQSLAGVKLSATKPLDKYLQDMDSESDDEGVLHLLGAKRR